VNIKLSEMSNIVSGHITGPSVSKSYSKEDSVDSFEILAVSEYLSISSAFLFFGVAADVAGLSRADDGDAVFECLGISSAFLSFGVAANVAGLGRTDGVHNEDGANCGGTGLARGIKVSFFSIINFRLSSSFLSRSVSKGERSFGRKFLGFVTRGRRGSLFTVCSPAFFMALLCCRTPNGA